MSSKKHKNQRTALFLALLIGLSTCVCTPAEASSQLNTSAAETTAVETAAADRAETTDTETAADIAETETETATEAEVLPIDTSALDNARIAIPRTHREPEFYRSLLKNLPLERRMMELGGKYSETGIPAVALTFDDGPSDNTSRLLDLLEQYNGRASFFIVGKNVAGKEDIVKREADLGCELGTHTWNHSDLATLTEEQINNQIDKSVSAIENAAGKEVTLLRPPYGSSTKEIRDGIDLPVILWSVDTLDWKTRNAASTVNTFQNEVQGGDIILFHDLYTETVDAVEELLPWLEEQGYLLLTVTELYYYYNCELDLHKAHGCAR